MRRHAPFMSEPEARGPKEQERHVARSQQLLRTVDGYRCGSASTAVIRMQWQTRGERSLLRVSDPFVIVIHVTARPIAVESFGLKTPSLGVQRSRTTSFYHRH
jgi:hypothetical protein